MALGDNVRRVRNKIIMTRLANNYLVTAVHAKLIELDKTSQELSCLLSPDNPQNDAHKARIRDYHDIREELLNFLGKIEVKDG